LVMVEKTLKPNVVLYLLSYTTGAVLISRVSFCSGLLLTVLLSHLDSDHGPEQFNAGFL